VGAPALCKGHSDPAHWLEALGDEAYHCFDGQRLELDGDLSKIRTKMDIHIQRYTKVTKAL